TPHARGWIAAACPAAANAIAAATASGAWARCHRHAARIPTPSRTTLASRDHPGRPVVRYATTAPTPRDGAARIASPRTTATPPAKASANTSRVGVLTQVIGGSLRA